MLIATVAGIKTTNRLRAFEKESVRLLSSSEIFFRLKRNIKEKKITRANPIANPTHEELKASSRKDKIKT